MHVTLAQKDKTLFKAHKVKLARSSSTMESPKSLPERMFLVFEEIKATNKKLQELGVKAESVLEEAKQNGNFRNLEKYEDIAKNAASGVLTDPYKSKKSNMKRCRWWNRGYCREGTARCPYNHPTEDCEQNLQDGHCFIQGCTLRHRRRCKYWGTADGCFRKEDCQYLHVDDPNNVTAGKENAKVVNMSQDKPLENLKNKMDNTQEDLFSANGNNSAYKEPDYSECSIRYKMVSSTETMNDHINSMHTSN